MPLVSVLLPVYNAELTLHESISSILTQDFKDFELIILLDGATDKSKEISLSFSDSRIKVVDSHNIGLVKILNLGIRLARGRYIARQDADDISAMSRLGLQINYLALHPEVKMVGTWAQIIAPDGRHIKNHRHPISDNAISIFLLFDNPFVHSSVMIDKNCLQLVGQYDEFYSLNPPEDYDLWVRIANISKVANMPLNLVRYREASTGISKSNQGLIRKNVISISTHNLYSKYEKYLSFNQCQNLAFLYHDPMIVKLSFRKINLIYKFIWILFRTRSIKNIEAAFVSFKIAKKMTKNFIHCMIN